MMFYAEAWSGRSRGEGKTSENWCERKSSLTDRHRQIACTYLLLVTVYR